MLGKLRLPILTVALCLCVGFETNPVTGREELMLVPEDHED
ncbi:MAG: hypothetical protein ACYSWO_02705 [Planctomycetota bacterium]